MIESSICALIFASAINPTNVAIYLPLLMLTLALMVYDNFKQAE